MALLRQTSIAYLEEKHHTRPTIITLPHTDALWQRDIYLIFLYCMPVFLYTLVIKWERFSHQFLELSCLLSNNNNNTGEIIADIYTKSNTIWILVWGLSNQFCSSKVTSVLCGHLLSNHRANRNCNWFLRSYTLRIDRIYQTKTQISKLRKLHIRRCMQVWLFTLSIMTWSMKNMSNYGGTTFTGYRIVFSMNKSQHWEQAKWGKEINV